MLINIKIQLFLLNLKGKPLLMKMRNVNSLFSDCKIAYLLHLDATIALFHCFDMTSERQAGIAGTIWHDIQL